MEQHDQHHHVRIHIDQKPYEAPNPTTGDVLYLLGAVPPELELYREVEGRREDEPIERGPEKVHLRQDEHFHSGKPKEYVLIVNGQKKPWLHKQISYDQVVKLAFPIPPSGQVILYSVSYEDGPHKNPQGSMKEGDVVKVKDGMVFNVSATIQS